MPPCTGAILDGGVVVRPARYTTPDSVCCCIRQHTGLGMAARGLSIKQTKFVAAYLGEAKGNATEAARMAGYKGNDVTLGAVGYENINKPHVLQVIESARAFILEQGISVKQSRIDALNDRWERMKQVITERAADPSIQHVPGGKTGLLVHQQKMIGAGPSAQIIDEYQVDTGLLREMREHEKHAAQEMGQWTEKLAVTGVTTFADLYALATADAGTGDSQPGE